MNELPIEDVEAVLAQNLELEDALAVMLADTLRLVDLRHYTQRMLQALDAYWLHYEGLPHNRWITVRSTSTDEDWWGRYERYRERVEGLLR